MSAIDYHLRELETAQTPDDPSRIMPTFRPAHQTIVDIGCGIGQTFIAAGLNDEEDRTLIGLDIDQEVLVYGHKTYTGIQYLHGTAEHLPLVSNSVDMVVSRVSLPYTNIPIALAEIYRVLKPGGEVWLTLHPLSMATRHLMTSIKRFRVKDIIFRLYVLLNGLFFHLFGRLLAFPFNGRMESVQTASAMKRALEKRGFTTVNCEKGRHFLVTAVKPQP